MKRQNKLTTILPELAPLSFGGWALGGEYWGEQDHRDSVRAIHRALALGVSHFDTAPVYGKGKSEQIIGQQLKKIRNSVTIASKAFYSHPEKMKYSFETSLKRLLTDYIDIFYIHWPLSGTDMRPGMEMLESLRREGRIRAIGVSNFSLDQLKMVEQAGTVDVYQGGYNLFWTPLENEIIPYLQKNSLGFIPYGVLAQGLLTDKGLENLEKSHEGFRDKMILYNSRIRPSLKKWIQQLMRECGCCHISLEQSAALFTLKEVSADTVLLGVRNRDQADRNFQSVREELPPSLKTLFSGIKKEAAGLIPEAPNLFNHKS